jgi:hypothetical protein
MILKYAPMLVGLAVILLVSPYLFLPALVVGLLGER